MALDDNMVINISVQYKEGGFLPDITLLTQKSYYYHYIGVYNSGFVFTAHPSDSILLLPCVMVLYYIVSVLFLLFFLVSLHVD